MDQIDYNTIYIKFQDGVDKETREQIINNLKNAFVVWWGFSVFTAEDESDRLGTTKELLDMTFDGCILVVMFLSFFSLSASMSANLYS